jgi:hypothetical protein
MINDTNEQTITKIEFFLSKKINVHITKRDNEFLNGIIVQKESDGVYIISERKFGLMHLFVSDIASIEEYREVGK